MNWDPLSRRGFLQQSAATLSLSQALYAQRKSFTPADFRQFQLRKEPAERVEAGRQIILAELKPTQAQLQRGLARISQGESRKGDFSRFLDAGLGQRRR